MCNPRRGVHRAPEKSEQLNGEPQSVGAGYSPDRGNVCEADKRVPVFGENPRPPEHCWISYKQMAVHQTCRGELRSPADGRGRPSLRANPIYIVEIFGTTRKVVPPTYVNPNFPECHNL